MHDLYIALCAHHPSQSILSHHEGLIAQARLFNPLAIAIELNFQPLSLPCEGVVGGCFRGPESFNPLIMHLVSLVTRLYPY